MNSRGGKCQSQLWRKQSSLNLIDDSCYTWHGDWTEVNRCHNNHWTYVLLGPMKTSATLHIGRGRESKPILRLIPKTWCLVQMLFQWSISKSTLGTETVVTQETLVMSSARGKPCTTPQLSSHADNLIPTRWWHSLFTYQLPLVGQGTSQTKMFLALAQNLRVPAGLVGSKWKKGRSPAKEGLRSPILALQKQLHLYHLLEEASVHVLSAFFSQWEGGRDVSQ